MVVNGINYLYHMVMGRVLGPVDYGVLAALYSLLYIVGIIPASTSIAVVKFISSVKEQQEVGLIYQTLKKATFYLGGVITLLIFLFSPLISNFLHIGNVLTTALVGVIFFLSLITLINQATSQGLLRFVGSVGPNLISAVIKFGLGLLLVLIGWSVFGAIIGIVVAAILSMLYSFWYLGKIVKSKVNNGYDLKPFLKYSLPVLLQALAFTSFFTTDVLLIKHFFPAFEAGLYAALSMLGKIIFFASSPITATMFPIVAGRKSRGETYLKVFLVSFLVTITVSLFIVSFYKFFPELAISLLYGEKYLAAQKELVWMGTFLFCYTLAYLLVNFSLSLGKTRIVVLPLTAALLQTVAIWFWHGSILQVIQISLVLSILLLVSIFSFLGYNQLWRIKSFFRS